MSQLKPSINKKMWGPNQSQEALRQVADLCQSALYLASRVSPNGTSFSAQEKYKTPNSGILSVSGKIVDDSIVVVKLQLVRGPENIRVPLRAFFEHLSSLGEKVSLLPPENEKSGENSLWLELKVKALPMSMVRASAFTDEIKKIDKLARSLQAELPTLGSDSDLAKIYKKFSEVLEPIHPQDLENDDIKSCPDLISWARDNVDFLSGSNSLAIASSFPAVTDFSISVLARIALESGISLGNLLLPTIDAKGLLELAGKAPGTIVVPAIRLSLGTNPYELGNEMKALLAALSSANKPVIFTGQYGELQAVFHGGQGGSNDPLFPIIRRIPDISIKPLAQFAVQSAGRLEGGIPKKTEINLTKRTLESIQEMSRAEQNRILPIAARRIVSIWSTGKNKTMPAEKSFVAKVSGVTETLAGLSPRPRAKRSPNVQEHFTKTMTDPQLLSYLKEHLLAQDWALAQLVERLNMESLTRPLHQPIRYCLQGTPATGKSESAVLLAKKLGIPYVNIDAASMPDYQTAASQLLGSGRGIVMSHKPGRLEQVAKHHAGALVEVSDLDHAVPNVRTVLADLFLQVLETGEAQSATGAVFSCANVIFAFTINLPGGMDEKVRKGIGFNNAPTRKDVSKRVVSGIKMMLSSAFLSRIGTPILFEPLDGQALAEILEHSMKKAILSASRRLDVPVGEVTFDKGFGEKMVPSLDSDISSFGARALLEHGRSVAAKAFVEFQKSNPEIDEKPIRISVDSQGKVFIKPEQTSEET